MSGQPAREPEQFRARDEPFDLSAFPCPRCETVISAQEYGPCPACIEHLKVTQRRVGEEVVAAAYEPKMNVTPNAVALKDD